VREKLGTKVELIFHSGIRRFQGPRRKLVGFPFHIGRELQSPSQAAERRGSQTAATQALQDFQKFRFSAAQRPYDTEIRCSFETFGKPACHSGRPGNPQLIR
jgi:hypothetical protein